MAAFDVLYETYYPIVLKTCLAQFRDEYFATEITQEAFTRAYIKLGNLRDTSKFPSWVTSIALRYGYLKSRQDRLRYNPLPPDEQLERDWYAAASDDLLIEELNLIRRWILTLKESDQQIFLMKYYYLMTTEEIRQETGKAPSTIRRRLSLLKAKLKTAIEEDR